MYTIDLYNYGYLCIVWLNALSKKEEAVKRFEIPKVLYKSPIIIIIIVVVVVVDWRWWAYAGKETIQRADLRFMAVRDSGPMLERR